MPYDIKGKIALVTGAATGIGLAYVKELLRNGVKAVTIADIDATKGEDSAKRLNHEFGGNKVIFIRTDVTKADQLEAAFKTALNTWKGLDIVINNAGIMNDANWELQIAVNCNHVVRGSLLAIQYMGKNNGGKGGVVVNIASILGLQELAGCPIYVGTKHFVVGLDRSFGTPFFYNLTGIQFLTMCPGVTDTPLISEAGKFALQGMGNIAKELVEGLGSMPEQHNRSMSSSPVECKVALITGGAIGIGLAIAKSVLRCGARGVMLGDIKEKEGQKAVCELSKEYGENKVCFMKSDVTKKADNEKLFKVAMDKFKSIDIVVNNAGLLHDKDWELEIDVNMKGLVHGTLLGFQHMGKHKNGEGGVIINIASVYGLQQAHGCPVYNGSKYFVIGFSKAMSHKYYEELTGVKVLTMCPGVTETQLIEDAASTALEGFGDVGKILKDGLDALPAQP
ncbi:adh short, KR and/or NAD binding 4 domain containing protein [Asbolus verrucosus]|uniref:Adh short, KR and/or NAD binding 4 domain containing protein n=1 Tax=Asbolus verrucosus TaxID=1661398 RepID=A0A482VMI2_ASBVE|nr:adh short, KR and/or NAD binding 4 domain containing protein [Asbolus verrucosus]